MVRRLGKAPMRTDFVPDEYNREIRDYGYRCFWSSAEICPCRLNDDTEQPDPVCGVCDGSGWIYTMPDPEGETLAEYLESVPPFESRPDARATQAIITSMTHDTQTYEKFGEWLAGAARLTSFTFNRYGFRDRFELVDAVMPYKQTFTVPDSLIVAVGNRGDKLRYPIVSLQRVVEAPRGADAYVDHTEACAIVDGALDLSATGVAPGTRIGVRYDMHPVWIVNDFPYGSRESLAKTKSDAAGIAKHIILPTHAFVKLDFLLSRGVAA